VATHQRSQAVVGRLPMGHGLPPISTIFLISILFYFKIYPFAYQKKSDPFVLIHVSYLVFRYYVYIFGFLLMII
jgi:hypothetical protein